jgi:hypothetical protein
MSQSERLRVLEKLGEVPACAERPRDLYLAERTSWWGKPLDPRSFWKGRVLWCDQSAKAAAAAHGRLWPPMPYEDPSLPPYPNDDGIQGKGYGAEGTGVGVASSSKESAFWCKFIETHPKPPEDLEARQFDVAEQILNGPKLIRELQQIGGNASIVSQEMPRSNESLIRDAVSHGYPPEAFSTNALFWGYVERKRRDYDRLKSERQAGELELRSLLERLLVDTAYIKEPLTSDQQSAADAWKIAYLRRLRNEKTNETYIVAYLKAWNLSADSVFKSTN